jgi:hypothetical protein
MKMVTRISVALVVIMSLGGCTHFQVAKPPPLEPELLAGVRGGNLTFINAQPATEDFKLGSVEPDSFYADLNQWTEAAISLIQRGLPAPSVSASNRPARVLALSITHAELRIPAAGLARYVTCKVHLQVRLGSDHTLEFEGERASARRYTKACNVAITDTVSNMLKDTTVHNYLADQTN